jgi:phosphatidylglycerol:prolipoprotein diacylglycerol transferase
VFSGPYIHTIDPVIGSLFGLHFWWYGGAYALGFLFVFLWIRLKRSKMALSVVGAYALTLSIVAGALLGGRFVEVIFYEWPFYSSHPSLIPALWLGGMATHGLLAGGILAIALYSWSHRQNFFRLTDFLAIPAAFVLGVGRFGNFIDGHIVGSLTTLPWGVQFPDAEGFRHPVVLYDGFKNLMLIPILMVIIGRKPPIGVVTGAFLFGYAFPRLFVDLFREYPTTLLGLATGQTLNLMLSLVGLVVLLWSQWKGKRPVAPLEEILPEDYVPVARPIEKGLIRQKLAFALLLFLSVTIPSDWTQDIPAHYGKRHPGLWYSSLYPRIEGAPKQ